MKECDEIQNQVVARARVHQNSLKVPNGGTMSGALLDGKEERERVRRGALTTNILFLVDRMSRFKWCAVRSCLDVINPDSTLPS